MDNKSYEDKINDIKKYLEEKEKEVNKNRVNTNRSNPIKNDNDFGIHVNIDIEMVDGDDPIPISFEIISNEIHKIEWNNQIKLFLIHLKNAVGNFLGTKE